MNDTSIPHPTEREPQPDPRPVPPRMRIGEHTMISDLTIHTASRIVDDATPLVDAEHWRVSWLPGRVLTRNQAITAMTLAEAVVTMQDEGATLDICHRLWPHVDNWARELGLTGPDAMAAERIARDAAEGRKR